MTTLLEQKYKGEIVPALMEQFKYGSIMEVPRLTKVTLNMGLGEAVAAQWSSLVRCGRAAAAQLPSCCFRGGGSPRTEMCEGRASG